MSYFVLNGSLVTFGIILYFYDIYFLLVLLILEERPLFPLFRIFLIIAYLLLLF